MKQLIILILVLFLIPSCHYVQVAEGETGVYFKRFDGGVDTDKIYEPGTYFVPNWDNITIYNTGAQIGEIHDYEGNEIKVKVKYEFRLIEEKANTYHNKLGGDPIDRVRDVVEEEYKREVIGRDVIINSLNVEVVEDNLLRNCQYRLAEQFIELSKLKIEY